MRLIKFRGYAVEEKKWVYGEMTCNPAFKYPIIDTHEPDGRYFVYPESVGQYTDAKDFEGHPIYEGDIMTSAKGRNSERGIVEYCPQVLTFIVSKPDNYYETLSVVRYNWIVTGNSYQPKDHDN